MMSNTCVTCQHYVIVWGNILPRVIVQLSRLHRSAGWLTAAYPLPVLRSCLVFAPDWGAFHIS
jgi:hypothetical protein